jgi:hypothetical protein
MQPRVTSDSDGNAMIVWRACTNSHCQISARPLDATGAPSADQLRINRVADCHCPYSVVSNKPRVFVVVWGLPGRMLAERVGVSGERTQRPYVITEADAGNGDFPAIARLPNGELFAVWRTSAQAAHAYSVLGQRLDWDGRALGGVQVVSTMGFGGCGGRATVAATRNADVLVTWNLHAVQSLGYDALGRAFMLKLAPGR